MRRRPEEVDEPLVETRMFWARAARFGFGDEATGMFDPPSLAAEFPSRVYAARLYAKFRVRCIARFRARPTLGHAFPVAEFEVDDELRAEAAVVVAAARSADDCDPREEMR